MTEPVASPSLWEYVRARLARLLPRGWLPASWWREDAWLTAVEEAARAAEPPASPTSAAAVPSVPQPEEPPSVEAAVATRVQPTRKAEAVAEPEASWPRGPFALTLSVLLAWAAQTRLEPAHRQPAQALVLYGLAALLLALAASRGEVPLAGPAPATRLTFGFNLRLPPLVLAAPFALLAFLSFGGNRFTALNLTLWGTLLLLLLAALLEQDPLLRWRAALQRLRTRGLQVQISAWGLLVLAVLGLGVFLRFYRLSSVPREMFSDHAEKLYDVMDVLDGQWRIFFPRNTGREGMQMYAGALAAQLGAGISFMTLKVPMAVAAAVFLPVLYAWARLWDPDRRTALWTVAFAGVAYWLHTIHRVGLRFMLYPTFAVLTLYFVLRGLQRNRRDDFVWAGLFLGLGLHGYSPFRVVPLVVVLTLVWYGLHQRDRTTRQRLLLALLLVVVMSVAVFLPLLRYLSEAPQIFFYRMNTRWAQLERPYPGPPLLIFVQNVGRALVMFWWDNGTVWADSVVHRPALEPISAALLAFGVVLVLIRYLRRRHWQDGWLLLLIPLLQLPSTLALAFPQENPTLHRTGATLIPVFLLVGLAASTLQRAWQQTGARRWGWLLVAGLWLLAWRNNHDLVFRQYLVQYRLSNWNTPEIGQVIGGFARSVGDAQQAWVIPYPYWVDTRLVGIEAGYPRRDYALPADRLADSLSVPAPKLFILKPEDTATLDHLWALYPRARVWRWRSSIEGKDFVLYFVPEGP